MTAELTEVASVVGAVTAIAVVWFSAVTHRMTVKQRKWSQATLVSVWAKTVSIDEAGEGHPARYRQFEATLENRGDQPVYDVALRLLGPDWQNDPTPVVSRIISVWTPQETGRVTMPGSEVASGKGLKAPPMAIEFTDNQGVRWKRMPDGTLTEVKLSPWRWLSRVF